MNDETRRHVADVESPSIHIIRYIIKPCNFSIQAQCRELGLVWLARVSSGVVKPRLLRTHSGTQSVCLMSVWHSFSTALHYLDERY